MKKRQKKLASLLLACMMLYAPTAQVMAETTFEASAGVSGQLLFPNDSLANVPTAVMLDGQETALQEGMTWKNTDENKVYSAQSDENGVIQLTQEGYVLVVEGGVSQKNNESEETPDHHYKFRDEEKPGGTKDIACYEQGETVRLKADEPAEGMVFAGWTSDTEGVTFADPMASETTIQMLDKKVTVKAAYAQAPAETEPPVETEPAADPSAVDPNAADPNAADPNAVDPNTADTNAADSSAIDPNAADPNAGAITVDPGTQQGADVVIDTVVAVESQAPETSAPAQYNLYVNNGSGAGSYEAGAWVTVAANDRTAEGMQFSGWTVEPANVTLDDAAAESAGFTMPAEEVVLTAQYEEIPEEPVEHTVTVNYGTLENGANTGTYDAQSWVIINANDRTAEGLEFNGWFVDTINAELDDPNAASTGFTMPEGQDVTISAQYKNIETEVPVTEAPTTETPAAEAPTTEAPVTEAPTTEVPAGEATTAETPITEATATEAPAADTSAEETEPIQIETSAPVQTEEVETEPQVQTYSVVVENGLGSADYAAGETVTVEAPENEGQEFEGWQTDSAAVTLDDPSQEVATFTMPAEDVTLTAEYTTVQSYQAMVEDAVFADGTTEARTIAAGEKVTVAAPDKTEQGLLFKGWKVLLNGVEDKDGVVQFEDAAAREATFTMPEGNVTVSPVYEEDPNAITISISMGLINGSAEQLVVQKDTSFTITAAEAPYGQEFMRWVINDGAYDLGDKAANPNLELKATENMEIRAVYDGIEYGITVENGYSDYEECVVGTKVTITADEAPEGYEFDYWYVDSENAALADAYSETTTFTMPDSEVTVTANYRQVEFQVFVENGYADEDFYYAGDTVTVYSNYPASGRVFNQWKTVSGNTTFENASRWKTTFVMPDSDVTVKATYKDGPSTNDNQILDIVAGGEYVTGETIKFTASGAGMSNSNPNPGDYRYRPSGYQIGNVTGTWQSSPYTTSMAIKATGEYTLKVIYNKDVFDGSNWVSDGTSDAKSVTFRVITPAESVATGDDTPIILVIAIAAVSCVLFIILLIMFLKKRRSH